ncbi:phospholipase A2 inhibitor subunit gamma B-like [Mauremys reevesii]|uniref:phospholipase A2 inhibitor subunit gamma B-like n=1 Tax=Mauremys reevesii TaxID=260615 RepID=UPI00193EE47C|nr:phospholipase A2 inhibitor subunit gamma B-like [Mauremys reevesii]
MGLSLRNGGFRSCRMAKELRREAWIRGSLQRTSQEQSGTSVINPPATDLAASQTPAPIYCFPITMEASLAACILAALLAMGACLRCEVCNGPGTRCTGQPDTCTPGQDSCAIALTDSTLVGSKSQTIIKNCVSSDVCKASPFSAHFGNAMTRMSFKCCVGDACKTTDITVPPADPTPNGRRCPGCYALNADHCNEQTIHCTGSETQCINATGTITIDRRKMQTVMKGCASESICVMAQVASRMFTDISADLTMAKCTEASGVAGGALGPAGILLPALAGLLLKLLS